MNWCEFNEFIKCNIKGVVENCRRRFLTGENPTGECAIDVSPPSDIDIGKKNDTIVAGIDIPDVAGPVENEFRQPDGLDIKCDHKVLSDGMGNGNVEENVSAVSEIHISESRAEDIYSGQSAEVCVNANESGDVGAPAIQDNDICIESVTCIEEESSATPVEPVPSILDNRPYVKLLEDLFLLSSEVSRISEKSNDANVQAFAEHVYERLEDVFERNGLTPIDSEKEFDVRRHQSVPVTVVPDGTPISETLLQGWCLESRVMRRAKVKVNIESKSERINENETRN